MRVSAADACSSWPPVDQAECQDHPQLCHGHQQCSPPACPPPAATSGPRRLSQMRRRSRGCWCCNSARWPASRRRSPLRSNVAPPEHLRMPKRTSTTGGVIDLLQVPGEHCVVHARADADMGVHQNLHMLTTVRLLKQGDAAACLDDLGALGAAGRLAHPCPCVSDAARCPAAPRRRTTAGTRAPAASPGPGKWRCLWGLGRSAAAA